MFWETHALDSYQLRLPQQLEVKAHDGTTLYATLLMPSGSTNPATVPLIVNPYGGPHAQEVVNQWHDNLLFDNVLAQHGFAVLRADNRGMGFRSRAFAQAAYRNFGPVQLEDQLTVVDAALDQIPQLDPKRLGWWGWSWGGTFTLYAMTHSDRFRAGVAVAPVTDWRNYDSIYTERYLGLPAEDADGYRDFSVVNSAAQLKGGCSSRTAPATTTCTLKTPCSLCRSSSRPATRTTCRSIRARRTPSTGPMCAPVSTTAFWRNLRCI